MKKQVHKLVVAAMVAILSVKNIFPWGGLEPEFTVFITWVAVLCVDVLCIASILETILEKRG